MRTPEDIAKHYVRRVAHGWVGENFKITVDLVPGVYLSTELKASDGPQERQVTDSQEAFAKIIREAREEMFAFAMKDRPVSDNDIDNIFWALSQWGVNDHAENLRKLIAHYEAQIAFLAREQGITE